MKCKHRIQNTCLERTVTKTRKMIFGLHTPSTALMFALRFSSYRRRVRDFYRPFGFVVPLFMNEFTRNDEKIIIYKYTCVKKAPSHSHSHSYMFIAQHKIPSKIVGEFLFYLFDTLPNDWCDPRVFLSHFHSFSSFLYLRDACPSPPRTLFKLNKYLYSLAIRVPVKKCMEERVGER